MNIVYNYHYRLGKEQLLSCILLNSRKVLWKIVHQGTKYKGVDDYNEKHRQSF